MKVECTKAEWSYLHALLLDGNNTAESYRWPNAECVVYCARTGYEFIRLEIKFTDIEELEKCITTTEINTSNC